MLQGGKVSDFEKWKGRIHIRAMTRVKLIVFNQMTHNKIKNNGVI